MREPGAGDRRAGSGSNRSRGDTRWNTESQAQAILRAQMPRALRQSRADDIITNDKDLAALQAAVEQLHTHYLALATQPTLWRPHAEC